MIDWEARYLNGETPWEKDGPSPPLRAWLQGRRLSGTLLAPGCGIGHDVRLLARHGAEAIGLDIAPSVVDRARRVDPTPKATFALGDFLELEPQYRGAFDYVYENTCFCAIPPEARKAYRDSARAALKPGGRLFGIFYPHTGNPLGEGPPYSIDPEAIRALFEPCFVEKESWVPAAGFHGRVGRELFMVWILRD